MAEISRKPAEGDRDQFGMRESSRLQTVADQTAETARQIGDKGRDAFRSAASTAAEATQRAGDVAAGTMSRAAEQGRDAVMSGLRASAGAQGPLADVGFEQSRRALETTSQIIDTYRQASERAAGDVRALFDFWMSFGRGLQQWQHAYLEAIRQSVEKVASKREEIAKSDSPVRLAEVQRDLYVDLVNATLRSTTNLLQLSGQIVQESARPLQERAQARG